MTSKRKRRKSRRQDIHNTTDEEDDKQLCISAPRLSRTDQPHVQPALLSPEPYEQPEGNTPTSLTRVATESRGSGSDKRVTRLTDLPFEILTRIFVEAEMERGWRLSRLAGIARVHSSLLPVARDRLYSRLTLLIVDEDDYYENHTRALLARTLHRCRHLSRLVQHIALYQTDYCLSAGWIYHISHPQSSIPLILSSCIREDNLQSFEIAVGPLAAYALAPFLPTTRASVPRLSIGEETSKQCHVLGIPFSLWPESFDTLTHLTIHCLFLVDRLDETQPLAPTRFPVLRSLTLVNPRRTRRLYYTPLAAHIANEIVQSGCQLRELRIVGSHYMDCGFIFWLVQNLGRSLEVLTLPRAMGVEGYSRIPTADELDPTDEERGSKTPAPPDIYHYLDLCPMLHTLEVTAREIEYLPRFCPSLRTLIIRDARFLTGAWADRRGGDFARLADEEFLPTLSDIALKDVHPETLETNATKELLSKVKGRARLRMG